MVGHKRTPSSFELIYLGKAAIFKFMTFMVQIPQGFCSVSHSEAVYFAHTPHLIQRIFDQFTWRSDPSDERVFLTFDDGPIPEVTPWVLDCLAAHNAKATFFCVGENVERHGDIFARLQEDGHAVGNHTHNHLSGWSSETDHYLNNVARCAEVVPSRLFRPPYGRISPRSAWALKNKYRIVMWDVLSGDFDVNQTGKQVLSNVIDNVRPGSIVVFHDSLKSERNLRYALPRALDILSARGYRFTALSQYGSGNAHAITPEEELISLTR